MTSYERKRTMYMNIALDENAIMPDRAHRLDAGLDLFTPVDVTVPSHGCAFVDTGVHVALPWSTRGHVCSKSGLNRDFCITTDGTVDEGYVGSIGIILHNDGDEDHEFRRGDKIAQLVVERIERPMLEVVPLSRLEESDRGDRGARGFGSTGR